MNQKTGTLIRMRVYGRSQALFDASAAFIVGLALAEKGDTGPAHDAGRTRLPSLIANVQGPIDAFLSTQRKKHEQDVLGAGSWARNKFLKQGQRLVPLVLGFQELSFEVDHRIALLERHQALLSHFLQFGENLLGLVDLLFAKE